MFEVIKVKFYDTEGNEIYGYHILKDKLPMFKINQFLDRKRVKSINTSKQYAYRLVKFFSFLQEKRNKSYKQATKEDVTKFINNILFDTENTLYISKSKTTYNTANYYLTVIKEFYKFLEDNTNMDISMKLNDKKKIANKNSFMYGQIWSIDNKDILDSKIPRIKGSKEYIKWYSEEEKQVLLDNLPTLRDKAVFLLTLEGLRIDEVLSLRLEDFDENKPSISPFRSKGKETGNVGSTVIISIKTVEMINNYIFNERDDALIKLQEKFPDKEFPETLFINLRNDEYLGSVLSYHNFIKTLKNSAKKSGIAPEKIRTHSGRSTKTMELLYHQVENPQDGLTDEHIRQIMRWKSPSSIIPYINVQDTKLAIETAKKIEKSKNKKGE